MRLLALLAALALAIAAPAAALPPAQATAVLRPEFRPMQIDATTCCNGATGWVGYSVQGFSFLTAVERQNTSNTPKLWSVQIGRDARTLRVEVRSGDKGLTSDAGVTDRAEFQGISSFAASLDYWVSYAFMLEPGSAITGNETASTIAATADAGDTATEPPFKMALASGGTMDFSYRTSNVNPTTNPTSNAAGSFTIVRGVWHRIVQHVKVSPSGSGRWEVWVDGTKIVDVTGATGYNDTNGPRWQFGIVRDTANRVDRARYANLELGLADLSGRVTNPLPLPTMAPQPYAGGF